MFSLIQGKLPTSNKSSNKPSEVIDQDGFVHLQVDREHEHRIKNRQLGDDALTSTLSGLYAKFLVVLGIAFPVTDILAVKAPNSFYQGFYLFLYTGSIVFVAFMYFDHLRQRRIYNRVGKGFEIQIAFSRAKINEIYFYFCRKG